jgi:hypothetical protein
VVVGGPLRVAGEPHDVHRDQVGHVSLNA